MPRRLLTDEWLAQRTPGGVTLSENHRTSSESHRASSESRRASSENRRTARASALGEFPVGRAAGWLLGYLLLCVLVGAGAGVFWERVVRLPGYTVAADGTASTTERGLAQFFGGDAWFSLIGFLVGIGLGIVAWKWFGRLGWPVVLVAIVGSVSSALVCWWVGYQLGPGNFDTRLAAARPGDFVPIALNLRSPAALLVWALGAIIPVLLRSSLGRDEEEDLLPTRPPRARGARRRNRRPAGRDDG